MLPFESLWQAAIHVHEFHHNVPGLLHDIANPLATATVALESVLHDSSNSAVHYSTNSLQELTVSLECLKHVQGLLRTQVHHTSTLPAGEFAVLEEVKVVTNLYQAKCYEKNIKIRTKIPKNMRLVGDTYRFRRIIGNLLANATDAYPETYENLHPRQVAITAKMYSHHITLVVQDWGLGIPRQHLKYIFHTTYSTKRSTGLGLSIVHGIVEQEFGGNISVKSTVGEGTVFTVRLPLKKKGKKHGS